MALTWYYYGVYPHPKVLVNLVAVANGSRILRESLENWMAKQEPNITRAEQLRQSIGSPWEG
jgi:hypothetical protein